MPGEMKKKKQRRRSSADSRLSRSPGKERKRGKTKRRNWLIPPECRFTFSFFNPPPTVVPPSGYDTRTFLKIELNRVRPGRGSTESKSLACGFGGRRAACPLRRSHIRLKELLGTPFRSCSRKARDGLRYGGMRPGYFRLHWHFRLSSR